MQKAVKNDEKDSPTENEPGLASFEAALERAVDRLEEVVGQHPSPGQHERAHRAYLRLLRLQERIAKVILERPNPPLISVEGDPAQRLTGPGTACRWCGETIPEERRADAQFCWVKCRVAAHRAGKVGKAPPAKGRR